MYIQRQILDMHIINTQAQYESVACTRSEAINGTQH